MTPLIQSASLCPIRSDGESIEVLLTRRAFWNYEQDRPMRYPGEWVFPGGQYEEGDNDLVETAVREFREELKYSGQVGNTRLLRSATQISHGKEYFVKFYAAQIDEDPSFTLHDKGEVIGVHWMAPAKALELIQSDEFTREQLEEFRQRGLGDNKYGIHAVNERQFIVQNVQTLELIQAMPELVGLYKNEPPHLKRRGIQLRESNKLSLKIVSRKLTIRQTPRALARSDVVLDHIPTYIANASVKLTSTPNPWLIVMKV